MIRTFFKTLLKIGLALGMITAVGAAILYLLDQKTDYIEVYDDGEGDLYE